MTSDSNKQQAALLYEQGNAHRKQQRWAEALNAYEQATALDPESPARTARTMLMEIMDFYCKDYYNP
ncbi:MAG: tetratricopeptide repeat protein [Bacteroidaceae bacterium]|nr:tetratricopeptide repeat protein [Bacteroidaceae bacterium]